MRDRAGAQADHIVAGANKAGNGGGQILRTIDRAGVAVAAELQPFDQSIAIDARDWRLSGGVDRGDQDRIGIVEAGAELVEQVAKARVAVRLDDGDDTPLAPPTAPP